MEKYEQIKVFGEGSFGEVLKCKTKATGEIVAIKRFKDPETDDCARTLIQREIQALEDLRGEEYVVQMKEWFRIKDTVYLVFEFIPNNMLEIMQENPKGMPIEMIRKYLYQVVTALHSCHKKGILHRDVKPENILVNKAQETAFLCDFGCARKWRARLAMTLYIATRWYRAPELVLGYEYDGSVDMWALGCVMAEMLTGKPLIPCKNNSHALQFMHATVGPLTGQQIKDAVSESNFPALKLPPPSNQLENMYKKYTDTHAMDFLKSLLQVEPQKRMTAAQALKHPYLEPYAKKYETPSKSLPASASPAQSKTLQQGPGPVPASTVGNGMNMSSSDTSSVGNYHTSKPAPLSALSVTARDDHLALDPNKPEANQSQPVQPKRKKNRKGKSKEDYEQHQQQQQLQQQDKLTIPVGTLVSMTPTTTLSQSSIRDGGAVTPSKKRRERRKQAKLRAQQDAQRMQELHENSNLGYNYGSSNTSNINSQYSHQGFPPSPALSHNHYQTKQQGMMYNTNGMKNGATEHLPMLSKNANARTSNDQLDPVTLKGKGVFGHSYTNTHHGGHHQSSSTMSSQYSTQQHNAGGGGLLPQLGASKFHTSSKIPALPNIAPGGANRGNKSLKTTAFPRVAPITHDY